MKYKGRTRGALTEVNTCSSEDFSIHTALFMPLLCFQSLSVWTHHHPLYVDLQFQLLYCFSSICNLGHVVRHPALSRLDQPSCSKFKNKTQKYRLPIKKCGCRKQVCSYKEQYKENLSQMINVRHYWRYLRWWLESVSICLLILLPGSQLQEEQGGSQRRREGERR